ncbi:MAG: hypothetical protein PUB22_02825, partial [Clostridiales bacterium]|nr:hypothetical protein [Clostridiales bacterium]
KTSLLPAYLLMGEYDFWSWDLDNGNVKVTLDYWTGRNQVGTAETPTTVETNGRFTTYDWKNADGITLYRYTQTAGRGHSFIPKENRMLWDWFDQWSRDSEKGILCNGVPIE